MPGIAAATNASDGAPVAGMGVSDDGQLFGYGTDNAAAGLVTVRDS